MARSPLPSTPGGTTMASHLEQKPRTQRSPLVSRSAKTLEDSGGLSDEARETKPDPFAHLYAQVCKASSRTSTTVSTTTAASPPSSTVSTKASPDETSDDVIYENLGVV
uniref:Docking protein 1a n=1 Tax=Nothobranchius korthausae TaxID=1143690 RepID=A0A1A8FWA5_9TELE